MKKARPIIVIIIAILNRIPACPLLQPPNPNSKCNSNSFPFSLLPLLSGFAGDFEKPSMLGAPVSGDVIAAEAGTLTFMVGSSEEAFVAAKLLFFSMGKGAIYCGGPGNGSAAKNCNNLALGESMLGVSEALALGRSLGVAASARCWSRMCALPNKAVEWFEKMPAFGCEPDGITCAAMAYAYACTGNAEMALKLYDRAKAAP